MNVDLGSVDWKMLRKQKITLYTEITGAKSEKVKDDLQGILHLIDNIQDQVAEMYGDDIVFQTV